MIKNISRKINIIVTIAVVAILLSLIAPLNVNAAATVNTVTTANGLNETAVAYYSGSGDTYYIRWYIGSTSTTSSTASNYCIVDKIVDSDGNDTITIDSSIQPQVKYNGRTYTLNIKAIGGGTQAVISDTTIQTLTISSYGTLTEISAYAFYNCTGLKTVTITDALDEIGESAFENCTGITKLDLSGSIYYIRASAFEGCRGLCVRGTVGVSDNNESRVRYPRGTKLVEKNAFNFYGTAEDARYDPEITINPVVW